MPSSGHFLLRILLSFFNLDEISRQLIDSDAKIIVGLSIMSPILEKSVEMTGKAIKIVYVKETPSSSIPASGIDFNELVETKGKWREIFYSN